MKRKIITLILCICLVCTNIQVVDIFANDNNNFSARKNALCESYPDYSEDERVVAEVEGNIYYSDYGIKSSSSYVEMITYPKVSDNTKSIRVWVESKNGSESEVSDVEIEECPIYKYQSNITAYPCKAEGKIQKDEYYNSIPKSIKTIINNQEYSANIAADGKFTLNYPCQANESKMTFIIEDQHGCQTKYEDRIYNSQQYASNDITALSNKAYGAVPKDVRIAVQIYGNIYYSDYGKSDYSVVQVNYPKQHPRQPIKVWYESINTSRSDQFYTLIYNRTYGFSATVRTSSLVGEIDSEEDYDEILHYNIFVKIKNKEYPCTFTNKGKTKFSCKYPKQKVGSTIQIIVRDSDGYQYIETYNIKNIKPKLKVNTLYSSDTRLTGKTVAKSKITVKIGKKKYKGKSKSNGNFSIKIKSYRSGTKVKIDIETPEGYCNSKKIKVHKGYGYVDLPSEVYKTSTKVNIKVTRGRKGDKVKLAIGNKTYTKKLTSNKKYQKVLFKIAKQAAGSKIKVTLTDKFGKKKATDSDMVYYGTYIKVGMSSRDALLTTWGTPTYKNDWGSFEQWVFESGDSILYVYVKGGVVTDLHRYYY